jgi:hypothetical protein
MTRVEAYVNRYELTSGEPWFAETNSPIELRVPDGPDIRMQNNTGFQQLVWRAGYDVLIRKLVALTGSPMSRKLTFEPAFGSRGYSPPWRSPASAGSRRPGGCWKASDTNQTVTSVAFVRGFNDVGHRRES